MSLEILTNKTLAKKGIGFVAKGIFGGAALGLGATFLLGSLNVNLAYLVVETLNLQSLEPLREGLEHVLNCPKHNNFAIGVSIGFRTLVPAFVAGGGIKGVFNFGKYKKAEQEKPINIKYNQYLSEGKSEEEAKYLAIKDDCAEKLYNAGFSDESDIERSKIKKALDAVITSVLNFRENECKMRILEDLGSFSSLSDEEKNKGVPLMDQFVQGSTYHLAMREIFIRRQFLYKRFQIQYERVNNS